jgi:maltokinase
MSDTLGSIGEWISGQRWFSGKGHQPRLRVLSDQEIPTDDPGARARILLVMDDEGHTPTLYQVPLVERTELQPAQRQYLIGQTDEGVYLLDAPHDPAFARALLKRMAPELYGQVDITSASVLSAEQSNTSIVFGVDGVPAIICKVFRALHHGDNPDVTLQSALSRAGSRAVPAFVGELHSEWDDVGQPTGRAFGHLAFAQEFMTGAEDGWAVALRFASAGEDFTALAGALGEKTAEVHRVLAEVLPTSDPQTSDIDDFVASWRSRLDQAVAAVPALLESRDAIDAVYAAAAGVQWPRLQRIHGDFHLGQALLVPERGWVLVDFEGEPLRPMNERDRPDVALRDVAGMLRSFDYAAGSTPGLPPDWAPNAREAFLDGYARASAVDLADSRLLLAAFEVDKAVYEAIYEALNRPDWLAIPLRGIELLVDGPLTAR